MDGYTAPHTLFAWSGSVRIFLISTHERVWKACKVQHFFAPKVFNKKVTNSPSFLLSFFLQIRLDKRFKATFWQEKDLNKNAPITFESQKTNFVTLNFSTQVFLVPRLSFLAKFVYVSRSGARYTIIFFHINCQQKTYRYSPFCFCQK